MSERIRDLPDELRPREKALKLGIFSLSDAELLALFIGQGVKGENAIQVGQRILDRYQSLAEIAKQEVKELSTHKGIGIAKGTLISAACELGRRISSQEITKKPLNSPELIYELISPYFIGKKTETLLVLVLDSKLHCIHQKEISSGTINQTICHPRDILKPVIMYQAYGFILVHNHPSGNPTPSIADREITDRIKQAAEIMQVHFLDHLIIGSPDDKSAHFYSFRSDHAM